jgi:cytochrome c biogenesis protein CcmG, thiol:disulfide interchange protein DsbE
MPNTLPPGVTIEHRRQHDPKLAPSEPRRDSRRRALLFAAAAAAVATMIAIGLTEREQVRPSSAGSLAVATPTQGGPRRVPDVIRANLREGNRVVDGRLQDRLAALKGVPVVVNQWASWCPPCRAELPLFKQLADRYRTQVAFVGLNSRDERAAAERFLREFPVQYPSVFDGEAEQARSIGAGTSWPTTVFYDAAGDVRLIHRGGYATVDALDADIRAYALGAG